MDNDTPLLKTFQQSLFVLGIKFRLPNYTHKDPPLARSSDPINLLPFQPHSRSPCPQSYPPLPKPTSGPGISLQVTFLILAFFTTGA